MHREIEKKKEDKPNENHNDRIEMRQTKPIFDCITLT